MTSILVAGVGNIFLGDDGFGVEAVRELSRGPLAEGVTVRDFGIRSYDLGYAIAEGYDAIVFVDATERGARPGTLSLIELDPPAADPGEVAGVNGHSLHPATVLRMAAALGAPIGRLYLVGCEPVVLESDEIGLSPLVQASLPAAAEMIRSLLLELNSGETINPGGPHSAAANKGNPNECLGNSRNRGRDPGAVLRGEDDPGAAALPAHASDVNA
jgi:hydrogenase maturation protease